MLRIHCYIYDSPKYIDILLLLHLSTGGQVLASSRQRPKSPLTMSQTDAFGNANETRAWARKTGSADQLKVRKSVASQAQVPEDLARVQVLEEALDAFAEEAVVCKVLSSSHFDSMTDALALVRDEDRADLLTTLLEGLLVPGDCVRLAGLVGRKDLNGRRGILKYTARTGSSWNRFLPTHESLKRESHSSDRCAARDGQTNWPGAHLCLRSTFGHIPELRYPVRLLPGNDGEPSGERISVKLANLRPATYSSDASPTAVRRPEGRPVEAEIFSPLPPELSLDLWRLVWQALPPWWRCSVATRIKQEWCHDIRADPTVWRYIAVCAGEMSQPRPS